GFAAANWRKGDLDLLHEWGLGGRRFGTVITWFLIGGDLYTAYTFIAVPALAFGAGAVAFFAVVHNRHLSNSFSGFSSALARLPQARLHHSRRFRARPLWQSLACSRDHRHRHRCDHAVYCASARWYSGRSRRAWNFRNRTRERLAAHYSLRHPGGLHLFERIASTCFDRNCEGYPDLHHRLRCDYRRSYPAGRVCKNLFGHS